MVFLFLNLRFYVNLNAMGFIKFYRSLLTSDNSTICLVTNTLLYEHKSTLSKNVKYVSNNFNLTVGKLSVTLCRLCNRLWFNNILNKYVQCANIIKDLLLM